MGTAVRPGEVRAWVEAHGTTLPRDFRTYLEELNGTDDDGDRFLFAFFPVAKMLRWQGSSWAVPDNAPANFHASHWFIFCDFMISSSAFAIHLGPDLDLNGSVAYVGWDKWNVISASFQEFVTLYLADDPSLYDPSPRARFASSRPPFSQPGNGTLWSRIAAAFRRG